MQFTTRTLLAVTAFVAISLGSYAFAFGELSWEAFWSALYLFCYIWFWMPLLFAAYALGRRKLTPWMVVCFAICQAAAFGFPFLVQWLDSLGTYTAAPVAIP